MYIINKELDICTQYTGHLINVQFSLMKVGCSSNPEKYQIYLIITIYDHIKWKFINN